MSNGNDPAFFHKRITALEEKVKGFGDRLADAGVVIEESRFALQAAKRLAVLVLNERDPEMQKVWAKAFLELYRL
jgi:hypothetical protein